MTSTHDPRVDAYINALPTWQQTICREVRGLVHDARFTLAVVFVKPLDSLLSIVERLLALVAQSGVRISCLYADKGFCSVALLRFLSDHSYSAIIPAPQWHHNRRASLSGYSALLCVKPLLTELNAHYCAQAAACLLVPASLLASQCGCSPSDPFPRVPRRTAGEGFVASCGRLVSPSTVLRW